MFNALWPLALGLIQKRKFKLLPHSLFRVVCVYFSSMESGWICGRVDGHVGWWQEKICPGYISNRKVWEVNTW